MAARLLDLSENIGMVAEGRFANLIAVRRDPLKDISALHQVEFVMKGGIIYKPAHWNHFRQSRNLSQENGMPKDERIRRN